MGITFEEWEKRYVDARPIEPCCASENPVQWAEIAGYAEDKLKEAFAAGQQSVLNNQNYDSSKDTLLHIKRVNELLLLFAQELMDRAICHDNSNYMILKNRYLIK